jgi:hypothetical protein
MTEPDSLTKLMLPNPGDLRVWWIVNPPAEGDNTFYLPVDTPDEAIERIDETAAALLQVEECWGNVFGLEVWNDYKWEEWEDDEGRNIDDYAVHLRGYRGGEQPDD